MTCYFQQHCFTTFDGDGMKSAQELGKDIAEMCQKALTRSEK